MNLLLNDKLSNYQPYGLTLLRIVFGYLIFWHGTADFFGIPPALSNPEPVLSLNGLAGILELLGGICLVLGLFTRFWGFVLCGLMAVAYWIYKATPAYWFWPGQYPGGESAVLFCFGFLLLFIFGSGVLSLDKLLFRRCH